MNGAFRAAMAASKPAPVKTQAPTEPVFEAEVVRPGPGRPVATPEIEEKVALLVLFFEPLPDGEELSWGRITADTGIDMATAAKHRPLVVRALKRLRRPYEAMRGYGIKLSSAETSLRMVKRGFVRIDNSVKHVDRVQKQLSARHLDQMSPTDQRRMIMAAGFFGAIRTFVRQSSTKAIE